jgi:hypothetical protein
VVLWSLMLLACAMFHHLLQYDAIEAPFGWMWQHFLCKFPSFLLAFPPVCVRIHHISHAMFQPPKCHDTMPIWVELCPNSCAMTSGRKGVGMARVQKTRPQWRSCGDHDISCGVFKQ